VRRNKHFIVRQPDTSANFRLQVSFVRTAQREITSKTKICKQLLDIMYFFVPPKQTRRGYFFNKRCFFLAHRVMIFKMKRDESSVRFGNEVFLDLMLEHLSACSVFYRSQLKNISSIVIQKATSQLFCFQRKYSMVSC